MRIFVDTSAWCALGDRADEHHRAAADFVHRPDAVLFLTSDSIVDETVALLRFRRSHRAAATFLRSISRTPRLSRAQVGSEHLRRAEEIFMQYRDKRWSFSDCVSFAFMQDLGLQDAFAFDGNFEQFGLRVHPPAR